MKTHKLSDFLSQSSNVTYSGRIKVYPDGWELLAASRPIFKESGWESAEWKMSDISDSKPQTGKNQAVDIERSQRRASARVREICRCNRMKYFVTLTLDPAKIDRYDLSAAVKKLRVWLDNRVRRQGLLYVLVPELHRDGAVHFHGFFNDAAAVVDSGTMKLPGVKKPRRPRSERQRREWADACGKPVYNLVDWDLGFSTALEITGDYAAAVGYCCKYIHKAGEKLGGRWYFSGGKLAKPEIRFCDIGADDVDGYSFVIPEANLKMTLVRGTGNELGYHSSGDTGGGCEAAFDD